MYGIAPQSSLLLKIKSHEHDTLSKANENKLI